MLFAATSHEAFSSWPSKDRGSIPRHGSIFLNLELHFVQQYPMPGCFGVVHVKWGEVYGEGGTNTFVTLHPTDLLHGSFLVEVEELVVVFRFDDTRCIVGGGAGLITNDDEPFSLLPTHFSYHSYLVHSNSTLSCYK